MGIMILSIFFILFLPSDWHWHLFVATESENELEGVTKATRWQSHISTLQYLPSVVNVRQFSTWAVSFLLDAMGQFWGWLLCPGLAVCPFLLFVSCIEHGHMWYLTCFTINKVEERLVRNYRWKGNNRKHQTSKHQNTDTLTMNGPYTPQISKPKQR